MKKLNKLTNKEIDILQYILLNEQFDILDTVKFHNFDIDLNSISIFLSRIYEKLSYMKKENIKNG